MNIASFSKMKLRHRSKYERWLHFALWNKIMLRDKSFKVASGVYPCLCDAVDERAIEVRSPAKEKDFSSSLCAQTGSGAHPASCAMGTGGPFPGGKGRPGRDADHSPHLVPRLWMSRSYTTFPCASVACSGTALAFNLQIRELG
jgi:hypothetical protein